MSSEFQLVRVIEKFNKKGDERLLETFIVDEAHWPLLRELFSVPLHDTVMDGYPITFSNKREVEKLLKIKFDLDNYEYFLSSYRDEVDCPK